MSHWEAAYALLVVQITLFSVMAGAAYLVITRCRPATAKPVLGVAVLLLLGLTAAAGLPLPGSWSLDIWPTESVVARPLEPPSGRNTIDQETLTGMPDASWTSIANAVSVRARPLDASGPAPSPRMTGLFRWTLLPKLLLLAGGIIAGTRLIRGLRSTRRVLRHSKRIDDVTFTALAEKIRRSIGCRPVVLRVSTDISSAATVGWRRPVLIVAGDWQQWSEQEKRAVLAHELTHVRSHDYLTGLVARITVALYFYHPLVRWLGTSFFVAQEVAADAAATRFVGGRANYLAALSRMALRHDRQIESAGVLAFASPSSTFLMRRIEMLQTKDGRHSPLTRVIQGATLGCLCLGAIAVSALRAPAQDTQTESQATVRTARKETRESTLGSAALPIRGTSTTDQTRPPIDLCYARWFQHGFVAFRPATIFGRPEIAATVSQVDEALCQYQGNLNVPDQIKFSLADVEQAIGPITFRIVPDAPLGERHALQIGLSMLRTTKPDLGEELLRAIAPGTKETVHEGVRILEAPDPPIPAIGPAKSFALTDPRTVLPFYPSAAIPNLLKIREDPLESAAWADDWALVQESTLAFVLDNTSGDWSQGHDGSTESKMLAHPEQCTEEAYWGALSVNMRYTVCGIDWRDDSLSVLLTVEFQSPDVASDVAAGLPELIAEIRAKAAQGQMARDQTEVLLHPLCIKLLNQIQSRNVGSKVHLSATAKLDPGLVAACLSRALLQEPGE